MRMRTNDIVGKLWKWMVRVVDGQKGQSAGQKGGERGESRRKTDWRRQPWSLLQSKVA